MCEDAPIVERRRRRRATAWRTWRGEQLPPAPAVYALTLGHRIAYIGSTDKLSRRVREHRSRTGTDFGIRYSICFRNGDWLRREHRLIERLRPPWNKPSGPRRR